MAGATAGWDDVGDEHSAAAADPSECGRKSIDVDRVFDGEQPGARVAIRVHGER